MDVTSALGHSRCVSSDDRRNTMSGPTTRPIRDDRFLAAASSNHGGEDTRNRHKGREPDGAPNDFAEDIAKGTPMKEAALKKLYKHCGTCGVVFALLFAWMLGFIPMFESPFASAADFEKFRDVVKEVLTRQISADIRAYQESLCRGRNMFLEGELERAQIAYEKQTGRRYPIVPCTQQRD